MTDRLAQANRVYIDSNICIYLVEGAEPFAGLAERALALATERSIPLVSSELALAECLYGVFKTGSPRLEPLYRRMFAPGGLIAPVAVGEAVLERAARIGGTSGLKLVDAIHLATALQAGCDAYLTNDRRFRDAEGLTIIQLMDVFA
jgi:predicted nucleic acid-binding protein